MNGQGSRAPKPCICQVPVRFPMALRAAPDLAQGVPHPLLGPLYTNINSQDAMHTICHLCFQAACPDFSRWDCQMCACILIPAQANPSQASSVCSSTLTGLIPRAKKVIYGLVSIFRQARGRKRDRFSSPSSGHASPKADGARKGEEEGQKEHFLEKGEGGSGPEVGEEGQVMGAAPGPESP